MNSYTAIANSTHFGLPSGNVYHDDEVARNSPGTTTGATLRKVPFGKRDALSARKCEVIKGPETVLSRLTRHGKYWLSNTSKALCIPLKVCNTVLDASVFAGYYVTVMTITGIGAVTGAMTGTAAIIKAHISSSPAEKSIREYSVSCALKVFSCLAMPYERGILTIPVFPVLASVTLFVAETVAIPNKRVPYSVYEQVWNDTCHATKAFMPVTDMTVNLFHGTRRWLQG